MSASVTGALLSVLLPIGVGYAALAALDRRRTLALGERFGFAYPSGATLIAGTVYALARAGVHFTRLNFALVAVLAAAACALLCVGRHGESAAATPLPRLPRSEQILTAALCLLIGTKIVCVFLELLHRPLTPWDSFSVWALRAKIWAARGGLLDPRDLFYSSVAVRPDYPPHVSLLQTWTAIWLGSWNDVLVNLPWGCYYSAALLFVFATLARHLPRAWALAGVFLLAGLPLFVVQAAVAGYADIVLSVHFTAAVIAVYLWASERHAVHLAIALLFTASLPFIKLEGTPLAVACAGGLIMQTRLLRSAVLRALLVVTAIVLAGVSIWLNDDLRRLLLGSALHREALQPLLRSFMGLGNWHLLWPLFIAIAVLRLKRIWGTPLAWLLATVIAAMLPFFYTLLYTNAAEYVLEQTAPGRLFLNCAPAAVFFIIVATYDALAPNAKTRLSN
jgi:hypothetical protein